MSSYMIRGIDKDALKAFRERCRENFVSPDEVLRAVIAHTKPEYVPDLDETRIAHRLAFHHTKASTEPASVVN